MYWVLDTSLLYHAASTGRKGFSEEERKQAHAAIAALGVISTKHQIAEDQNGRIDIEYRRCWKKVGRGGTEYPTVDAVHNLWLALWSRPHLLCEAKIPAALLALLEANNMKHDGDIAFVQAAGATPDKVLCAEDGDYSPEVKTHY